MQFAPNLRGLRLCALAFVAALLLASAEIHPAAAQVTMPGCPFKPEMTFTTWSTTLGQQFGEGAREYIFADGYFCSDTDQKFQEFLTQNPPKAPNTIIVLNSGGGDLDAGLRMGTIIRQQKMWTMVGSQLPLMIPANQNIPPATVPYISEPASPPFPGTCASACNFAFMGGIVRTVGYASSYSVHQFESPQSSEWQAQTEVTAAQIVAYLSQMGISPNFMVQMVKKTGNDVTDLTMAQLQQLNIVTPRWETKWQITPLPNNAGFYLDGITSDLWGTHDVAFTCAPKTTSPAAPPAPPAQAGQPAPPTPQPVVLVATFSLDPGARARAQDLVGAVTAYNLQLSGNFVPSATQIPVKQEPPSVVANRLAVTWHFTQDGVDELETDPAIGMAYLFDPAAKLPMRLLKFEAALDDALLKQFVATCH